MKTNRIVTICVLFLFCVMLSGCLALQIGGKTHNCSGSPDAEHRITQLENRIRTLEHYAGITPPQAITVASATVEAK